MGNRVLIEFSEEEIPLHRSISALGYGTLKDRHADLYILAQHSRQGYKLRSACLKNLAGRDYADLFWLHAGNIPQKRVFERSTKQS